MDLKDELISPGTQGSSQQDSKGVRNSCAFAVLPHVRVPPLNGPSWGDTTIQPPSTAGPLKYHKQQNPSVSKSSWHSSLNRSLRVRRMYRHSYDCWPDLTPFNQAGLEVVLTADQLWTQGRVLTAMLSPRMDHVCIVWIGSGTGVRGRQTKPRNSLYGLVQDTAPATDKDESRRAGAIRNRSTPNVELKVDDNRETAQHESVSNRILRVSHGAKYSLGGSGDRGVCVGG